MTPLHDAVNVCQIEVVRLLLKYGGMSSYPTLISHVDCVLNVLTLAYVCTCRASHSNSLCRVRSTFIEVQFNWEEEQFK